MDKFNVIIPTSNLDDLQNDMYSWTLLPYNLRLRSDEECIRRYNMTNIDLFNKLKAMIISNTVPEDKEMFGNFISEGAIVNNDNNLIPELEFLNDEEQDFIWKKQMANQLSQSPNIVIINPFRGIDKDYELEDLENYFNKYNLLTPKNKRFSNSYSLSIWGYDVPNMYNIMKKKLLSLNGLEGDIIYTLGESNIEKTITPLNNVIQESIVNNDKLGLLKVKFDSCENMGSYQKAIYENMLKNVNENLYSKDFDSVLPKVVPFFNMNEMKDFGLLYNEASNINPKDYYRTIKNKMEELKQSSGEEFVKKSEEIISLGWNPSVEINESNLKFARERQIKWLNEHAVDIVDVSKISTVVNESSSTMNNLYKKNNLYPIYIVLSYRDKIYSKIVRIFKHSEYSHAGLALDSNLRAITTFQFGAEWKGFANDDIEQYISSDKNTVIAVLALFVDKNTKMKIDAVIKDFVNKQEKTLYGFGNLFNILVNKSVDNDPENLHLVCSQFVDTVLKLANIDITNKSSNLVIPQDLRDTASNPKVFKLYEGLARKYNEKNIEDIIYTLFQSSPASEIKYFELSESMNNDKAKEIISEVNNLLTPQSVLVERRLPISFTDKGDLVIKLYKSLEEEYQEAHRLLKNYTKENLEAIKHELARLFYVNSAIEKKVKKMEKEDENYKKFIDLRARVLNDFKKYFKIVIEEEPDFNFSEYFKKSEYYNSNIIIDNSVLKFTGNLIKKFLKSLGI